MRMNEQPSHIRAAIAIGSQTIRLVVARSAPSDLDIVASREEVAPIGESVTATGAISPEKANAAIAVLKRYKALVRRPKADLILVVATAALRQHWDALLARDFKRQVLDALEREQSWMKQQKGRHSHAIIFRGSIGLVATTPANS